VFLIHRETTSKIVDPITGMALRTTWKKSLLWSTRQHTIRIASKVKKSPNTEIDYLFLILGFMFLLAMPPMVYKRGLGDMPMLQPNQ
jgi:hypothetical protein